MQKPNENFKELEKAAEPLRAFLEANFCLETIAIVSPGGIKIYSSEMSMPLVLSEERMGK